MVRIGSLLGNLCALIAMTLSIYPVSGYITQTVRDILSAYTTDALMVLIAREILMKAFKDGSKTINCYFIAKDFGGSEQSVVDAIDFAEKSGLLRVKYEENAKGRPVMVVGPTPETVRQLEQAKREAMARFS